jgi:two-component system, NtrC family, sensor kinase
MSTPLNHPAQQIEPIAEGVNTPRLSRSLITRLLLGGTVFVVGVTAYFSYQMVRHAMLENLKQKALLDVKTSAQTIDQWVALRKSETEAIANTPITQTMDWEAMRPYFASEHQRLKSFLPNLGIIDPEGKFYNLLKGANNPSLSDRPHFQQGMAGKSSVLDPIISRVTGKPIIVFAAPIWSELNPDNQRKPIGVINAPVGVDNVTQVVQTLKYGDGSYAFALNSKGEAITHPETSLMSTLEKPAPSLVKSADSNLAMIAQRMVNRQEGIELTTLNGIEKYAVFLPLKEVNWSVALMIPRNNIESQLKLLDGIAIIVLVLVITLIGVLMYIQTTEQAYLKRLKLMAEAEVAHKTAELQVSQLQIVQSEKMSALGNLVAGVAHEINNPIGCVIGNVNMLQEMVQDLFRIIDLYAKRVPTPDIELAEELENVDLDYLRTDLPMLVRSMQDSGNRIQSISKSLRTFSRDDTECKQSFNLHEGIENTLLILRHRLKANEQRPTIQVVQEYGDLSPIECFPGQLNQVFMNILANAIDMFDEMALSQSYSELEANPQQITIMTAVVNNQVKIQIADNGRGMPEEVRSRIFDHLFTTKEVGKGTGLGLSIAHQIIVEKHSGTIEVNAQINQGTEFVITLPQS